LATIAAATAAAAAQTPPQHKHEGMVDVKPPAAYKPRFFTDAEFALMAELVDLIIPRTDTPGARDARVHHIIDKSVRPAQTAAWRAGLRSFAGLTEAARITELKKGGPFFELLKGAVVDAYYSTREGLVTELGWNFNTYLPEFQGCTHPEHQS
jgi:hypothetical protein